MSKRWSKKRIAVVAVVAFLTIIGIALYANFNRLVSRAVVMSFESNIISDVYELKFEKLRVNIFKGDVRVVNVVFEPRKDPLRSYPYINSTIRLEAERITLIDVQLFDLLSQKGLFLKEISITRPNIKLVMSEPQPNLFPFPDTTNVTPGEVKKKAIESFSLDQFQLTGASIHVSNSFKQRETNVTDFNLQLYKLFINQKPGTNAAWLDRIDLSIGNFMRAAINEPFRRMTFSDFRIGIDSLQVESRVDTLMYTMTDFSSGLSNLDIHTADSLFHITVGSFSSSYKDHKLSLGNFSFTPNISNDAMQARYKYQNTQVSGKVGSVDLREIDFDSLIYYRSVFVDTIMIDKPEISVYKDKTKPLDLDRIPSYFGQQIAAMKLPIRIKTIKATHVQLTNVERKPDSTLARTTIERGTVSVTNVTNLSNATPLALTADAYLLGKIHFNLRLDFSYQKPEFKMAGTLGKFNLPDLNPVLRSYTPATISAGVAEEMNFSGNVNWTSSSGTMKFIYHDLEVDLALKDQAKWKSSIVAFAANTIVNTSNPGSADLPPREVKLHAERDMNKGFVNIIMKSLLNGVKETLVASKGNREAYQEAKKKQKKKSS